MTFADPFLRLIHMVFEVSLYIHMNDHLLNIAELKQHPNGHKIRGGRISSSSHRKSYAQVEDFTGLEENVNRLIFSCLLNAWARKLDLLRV